MKKINIIFVLAVFLFFAKGAYAKESCQITLSSPTPSNLSSSFVVSGTLDSYKESSGCAHWTLIENSIGTLSVYGPNGNKVAGPFSVAGPASSGYPDYAYPFPISFSQTITLDGDFPAGGKIVLSDYGEDDPYEHEEISTKTISSGEKTVSSSEDFHFTKILRYGLKGDREVKAMQGVLKKFGFFTGEATGDFGPKTKAALKKYQKLRGVDQTGTCGPKTRAWLNEDL